MAKIGALPEWLNKESFSKGFDCPQDRELLIHKFLQSLDTLRKENEDLRQQIQKKDQTINMMSIDYEPAKRNLFQKISLLCEKLQLSSVNDYEAWIEEVEVARLRSRFNEQAIQRLENTLKTYKDNILNLETQLRCFGVELSDSQTVRFDIYEYYYKIFNACEALDSGLFKSEATLYALDELTNSNESAELIKKHESLNTNTKYKKSTLQELVSGFEIKLEEINNKLSLLNEHEIVKRQQLNNFSSNQLHEIDSLTIQNINKSLKLSRSIIAMKPELDIHSSEFNQLSLDIVKLDKQPPSFKKLKSAQVMLEKSLGLNRHMLIVENKAENIESLVEISRATFEVLQNSESTLKYLMSIQPDDQQKIDEVLNRKNLIIQENAIGVEGNVEMIKKLLLLLVREEKLKYQILESGKITPREDYFCRLKEKLEIEEPILKSICEISKQPYKHIDLRKLTFNDLLNQNLQRLEIYKVHLERLPSISPALDLLSTISIQSSSLSSISENFKVLLQPKVSQVDISSAALKDFQFNLNSAINSSDIISSLQCIKGMMSIFEDLFSSYLSEIPQPMPALEQVSCLNEFMKESNFTVEVLAKAFGKEEKYRKVVGTEGIPKLEVEIERDFMTRWGMLNHYFTRVSEVGTKLELVKRSIIEDDIDSSKVTTTFNKASRNLLRNERAIGKLVQVCPDPDTAEELGAKLGKISKIRADKLKSIRKGPKSAVVMQDALEDLADASEEMNDILEKLAGCLNKTSLDHEENEILPELKWTPLNLLNPDEVEGIVRKAQLTNLKAKALRKPGRESSRDIEEMSENEPVTLRTALGNLDSANEHLEAIGEGLGSSNKIIEEAEKEKVKAIEGIKKKAKVLSRKSNEVLNKLTGKHVPEEFQGNAEGIEGLENCIDALVQAEKEKCDGIDEHFKELERNRTPLKAALSAHKQKSLRSPKYLPEADILALNRLSSELPDLNSPPSSLLSGDHTVPLNKALLSLLNQSEILHNRLDSLHQQLTENFLSSESVASKLNQLLSSAQQESDALRARVHNLEQQIKLSEASNSKDLSAANKSQQDQITNLQQQNLELIQDLTSLQQSFAALQEEMALKDQFHSDSLKTLFQQIGQIFVKSDYVGDTLIEVLSDSALKEEMDKYQQDFEGLIKGCSNKVEPEVVYELLELLDRYEAANGVQASRLAGISDHFAKEDIANLSESSKKSLSMKAKKNLRSGRPTAVAPLNNAKSCLSIVANALFALIKLFDKEFTAPEEFIEEVTFYETITKKIIRKYSTCISTLISIEIEREGFYEKDAKELIPSSNPELVKQLEFILESLGKHVIKPDDSLKVVVSEIKINAHLERELSKIRTEIGALRKGSEITEELIQACEETSRKSIETLKSLAPANEDLTRLRDSVKIVTHFSDLLEFFKSLNDLESAKQVYLQRPDITTDLLKIVAESQKLVKMNSLTIEKLWVLLLRIIGKDTDKFFIKSLLFTLPTIHSEDVSSALSASKETIVMFEGFIEKNDKKLADVQERLEGLFDFAGDVEEIFDEILRKSIKELLVTDDEKLKKQLVKFKDDFDGVADKSYPTVYEKFTHINDLIEIIGKLEAFKKSFVDGIKKSVKSLGDELLAKSNEVNTMKSALEAEKKSLKDRLDAAELSLKESSASFERNSKALSDKTIELANSNNEKSDLNNKIEDLNNEITNLNERILDFRTKIKQSESKLRERKEEIDTLNEKIIELESSSSATPVSDDSRLNSLRSDLNKSKEELIITRKRLEEVEEELMISKRNKETQENEVEKQTALVSELREEIGGLKAKILDLENSELLKNEKEMLGLEEETKSPTDKTLRDQQSLTSESETKSKTSTIKKKVVKRPSKS